MDWLEELKADRELIREIERCKQSTYYFYTKYCLVKNGNESTTLHDVEVKSH